MSISTEAAAAIERPRTSTAVTKLAGGGAALLFASVVGNALSYAFGIFVARTLGTEQFGLYVLGLTFFNLLVLFAPLALEIGVMKFASGQLAAGERSLARRTILCAGRIAAISGLLAGFGLALFAPVLSNLYHKPALFGVLLFFAAALPFVTLTTVLLGALQAFQTVRYTVWVKYIWEPAGKFLLAGFAFTLGFGLYGVLGGIVIVLAISAFIALWSLLRALPEEGTRSQVGVAELRALAAFSAPLIVSNLFGVLAPRSDMLILGYWVSAEQVGIYNAAFQTSAIIALILGAFDAAVAPVIGGLVAGRDAGTLQTLYHVTSRWVLTLTLPIFVLMAIWGHEILSLFGPSFALGGDALLILAAAQLFNTATGSSTNIMLMCGHTRTVMVNSILNGMLLIGVNMVLIPRYGFLGAAIGSAICQVLVSSARVLQVRQIRGVLPFSWSMVKPIVAAFVAIAAGWGLKGRIEGQFQWTLLVLVLGIFSGALFLFGFEDVDHLTAAELWRKLTKGARLS